MSRVVERRNPTGLSGKSAVLQPAAGGCVCRRFTLLKRRRDSDGRILSPMNLRPRARFAFLALPLVLAAAGCSAATATFATPAGTTREAIASSEPGPLAAVGETFGDVPLTAPQRARVTELFRAAEARHATAWKSSAEARKALLLAVADQVQAGAIDEAGLKPKIDAVAAPMKKVRDEDRASLVELHKTLTPEQRAAFVDALPKHMRESFMGKMGTHAEHRPPPPAANGAEPAPPPAAEHHFAKMHMGGPLMEAWKELDLTSDQRDQLKELFKKEIAGGKPMREAFAGHREERKQALESFKSDSFDGTALLAPPKGEDRAEKMVHFAAKALPILTPEQRAKVATMLRDRAAHADERPPMHGPR